MKESTILEKTLFIDRLDGSRTIEVSIVGHEGFTFNKLLPPGWRIEVQGAKPIHVQPDWRKIVIPETHGGVNLTGTGWFSLLHEIGHAVVYESLSENDLEREMLLRSKMKFFDFSEFTKDELDDYKRLVLGTEEQSWNFALKVSQELEKRGVKIYPKSGFRGLQQTAEMKLQTYKNGLPQNL